MRCWKISYQIIDRVKLSEFYFMENLRIFLIWGIFTTTLLYIKKEEKLVPNILSKRVSIHKRTIRFKMTKLNLND